MLSSFAERSKVHGDMNFRASATMHIQQKSVGISQISNICQFALRAELEQPSQPLAEGGSKQSDGMRQNRLSPLPG